MKRKLTEARLGERGYNILHNNCEHFANECAWGDKFSPLTDSLCQGVRAIPVVHVYVARFPFAVADDKISPDTRAAEIESCTNAKVRQQKYFVWKLLEDALMRSFGLKIEKLNIYKQNGGRWACDECYFSLSHSGNLVAVAVSRKPVGVDIEKHEPARFTDAVAEKFATDCEREELSSFKERQRDALNALWTKKEAVFKQFGGSGFCPKSIDVSKYCTLTKIAVSDGEKYFVTVASEDADKAVFSSTTGVKLEEFSIQVLN